LSMVQLAVPKLSERLEDLPLLERYFVEKFSAEYGKPINGITRRAQNVLSRYRWPGNVRELENVIGHACLMTDGAFIDIKDLPGDLTVSPADSADHSSPAEYGGTMEEVQVQHLLRVLQQVGGDKVRAAQVLGIGRTTIYSLLSKIDSKRIEQMN
jgi:DNA-binding NtrC family response regulator